MKNQAGTDAKTICNGNSCLTGSLVWISPCPIRSEIFLNTLYISKTTQNKEAGEGFKPVAMQVLIQRSYYLPQ